MVRILAVSVHLHQHILVLVLARDPVNQVQISMFRDISYILTPYLGWMCKKQIRVMLCLPFILDIYNPGLNKLGALISYC
jgi:hypothetical protein